MRGGGAGGAGGGGGGTGLAALTCGFGAGCRTAFLEAETRACFDGRLGRRAAFVDAFAVRPVRPDLRLEVIRAFTARRNFAMPGG